MELLHPSRTFSEGNPNSKTRNKGRNKVLHKWKIMGGGEMENPKARTIHGWLWPTFLRKLPPWLEAKPSTKPVLLIFISRNLKYIDLDVRMYGLMHLICEVLHQGNGENRRSEPKPTTEFGSYSQSFGLHASKSRPVSRLRNCSSGLRIYIHNHSVRRKGPCCHRRGRFDRLSERGPGQW